MSEICVSIFMLTYNQEDFIAQAIESVLMQQTDFNYQLVIGEDCSTDKTREICKEYAQKFPEKIKLILNEKNLGLIKNYIFTFAHCKGKYVAICDGDDYWIDPLKLQKQVEFLENNLKYKIVYTHNYNLFPNGNASLRQKDTQSHITGFNELVIKNYIPSVTVLFKNEVLPKSMQKWMLKYPFGDWPTYLFIIRNSGEIYFLNEITSVYRKDFGTSTKLRTQKSRMGEINCGILNNLLKDFHFFNKRNQIKISIKKYKIGLMASYNKERKFLKSFKILCGLIFMNNPFYILKMYSFSLKNSFHQN